MSNDPQAAVEWLEQQAAKGEPPDPNAEPFICPNTGTATCNDGTGCTAC